MPFAMHSQQVGGSGRQYSRAWFGPSRKRSSGGVSTTAIPANWGMLSPETWTVGSKRYAQPRYEPVHIFANSSH